MSRYKVIDLFCGCGGLSEGFRLAGFEIVGGIDFNEPAIRTYNRNFDGAKGICCDLLSMDKQKIIDEFGNLKDIDVIIGGPPCQGFSAANRYKTEGEDPRNKLFFEFVKFVDLARPKAIVIENVRGIVTNNNGYAKDRIYEIFESRGYAVNHMILNAADYGVPQKRYRNFFVMVKSGEKFDFDLIPKANHVVSVKEAIGELYKYDDETTEPFKLEIEPVTEYQRYLRESNNIVSNHEVRYPALMVQHRISFVPQGGNWQDVPEELWPTDRKNRHSSAYKRLEETEPSCTIDTGNSHSNYFHPLYNRIPTVREAARLQSFRDSFVFEGNRSEQYRQVGNAVPPLLARAIASQLKKVLDKKKNRKNKIIDLFCGCGGLSLGFEKAGFETKIAIDMWHDAVVTYNHNHRKEIAVCDDIHNWDDAFLENLVREDDIVGIIGGPPCQGYSTVGTRDVNDPRNHLYKEYCRIVEKVRPEFFVIENVKGLTTLSGGAFRDDIISRFSSLGYNVKFQILNAADYGIPQNRFRVFFVGMKKDGFSFPAPFDFKVTTKEAIGDLPILKGTERITEYSTSPFSAYQAQMRGSNNVLMNHEGTNHSQQTIDIISMIKDGGKIKDLPREYWDVRKYNKAFERMSSDGQSNTVDTGHRNYFHYDQNRIPSVRENARLQSFPDDFEFLGSKTSQYKQVGNAVPPLLAYAVAKAIRDNL